MLPFSKQLLIKYRFLETFINAIILVWLHNLKGKPGCAEKKLCCLQYFEFKALKQFCKQRSFTYVYTYLQLHNVIENERKYSDVIRFRVKTKIKHAKLYLTQRIGFIAAKIGCKIHKCIYIYIAIRGRLNINMKTLSLLRVTTVLVYELWDRI